MTDDPEDEPPAIHDWVTRAGVPAGDVRSAEMTPPPEGLPARVGPYAIVRKLGEGGMGVVYAVRDERLGRTIALKTMSSLAHDETARQRFWREARAAASVNHPNVCQIYEIGEDEGRLFIAMELLEGEPLSLRLRSGAMNVAETVPIGLGVLGALSALHAAGVVHRDLKPSNVFLTAHGVKLLDFGLARPSDPELLRSPDSDLTRAGMMVGTPRYMAPEQVTGAEVDARCDLFAAGTILFEMLAGRPAFAGRNVVEVLHATLNEQPPALTGSPAVAALDRVIRRALAKRAVDRPASAEAMSAELRAAASAAGGDTPALARTLTRLVVLPFRVLRPDPETDFLSFSLPDAIATSLSGVGSLVVRSSAVAARFGGEAPDLKALAAEADVDRVVMGSLLRAGDKLRATAQLVEAPGGTLLASHAVQSSMGDLFGLQDDIAQRVVDALALPLSGGDATPAPAAPPSARAYELYLRANELARTYEGMTQARELYERCLDLDPTFAPAWARLGRCHRVIGKFIQRSHDSDARAQEAFLRALELNPRLSIAHKLYANLEAEVGRPQAAVVRLLGEATRHGNDPELFAGLVHACRYCGLYGESIAAHHEARRLDPNLATSVDQSLLQAGEMQLLLAGKGPLVVGGGDEVIRVIALGMSGRLVEARDALAQMRRAVTHIAAFLAWADHLMAWLERRPEDMFVGLDFFEGLKILDDPEAIFQEGWMLCDVGEHRRGLELLQQAVAKGYYAAPTLARAPQFDALRGDAAFEALRAEADAARERALAAFRQAGGERFIGAPPASA